MDSISRSTYSASVVMKRPSIGASRKKAGPHFELSPRQEADLKTAFDLFDRGCTGFIEVKELKVAIRALGSEPTKEEILRMMSEIDRDGTGRISFNDFLRIMTKKMGEKDANEGILKSFRLFDQHHTGKISFRNLRKVAQELGENSTDEELQEMIDEFDLNNDGYVDQDEFLYMMKKTVLLP